jgi:hypothetical protein
MVVSSRDLAEALAARLDAVAPTGLRVRADGQQVSVYREDRLIGGSAAPRIIDESGDEWQLDAAATSTISGVQDVFAEELAEPWPASRGEMPAPEVRVADGVLLAWFGSAERPVLSLTPYTLHTR